MIALIDGDICVYRVGCTTQEEAEGIAAWRLEELIANILRDCETEQYKIFLTSTDKSNFRFGLYSEYKATRKQPKPVHYEFLRKYIQERHPSEVIYNEEADDALGYTQCSIDASYHNMLLEGQEKGCHQSIICSIDKDLLMIPGRHYNFVKKEFYNINAKEGLYNFYWQLLNGDTGDNIPGCPGIGPKSIEKIIHSDMCEMDLFQNVLFTYIAQYEKKKIPFDAAEDMLRNGRLLKIKQTKEEPLWEFPGGQWED